MSQKDPKRPGGSRDISELKARLGLKKGGAAAAGPASVGAKQNGASVVPPPGLNLPPPPGARAPGPVIPSAADDPFGAMNAMAAHGAAQRAPEIVIVNDGKPVESVATGDKAARWGKLAAIAVAPLILGVVIGQIAKEGNLANASIDTASALGGKGKEVDRVRRLLGEIKSAFENSGTLKDRKIQEEVTKSLDAAKDELVKNKLTVFKLRQDGLGTELRLQLVAFYALVQEINDLITDHLATAKLEEAAIKTGADQIAKLGAKGTLAEGGFNWKLAVLLTNPTEEGKEPQGARVVELGAPICGGDVASGQVAESGSCPEGQPPVGFTYRFGDSVTWYKGKIHVPGSLNAGEKFPLGELILPNPSGTLEALAKTSAASLAEADYFTRLAKIKEKVDQAYDLADKLSGDLRKKADEGKRFTFFL